MFINSHCLNSLNFSLKNLKNETFELTLLNLLHHPKDKIEYAANYFRGKIHHPRTIVVPEYLDTQEKINRIREANEHWIYLDNYDTQSVKTKIGVEVKSTALKRLHEEFYKAVTTRLKLLEVKTGDIIIKQGDPFDYFYLIKEGTFAVLMAQEDGKAPKTMFTYHNAGGFGELALIHKRPRIATVIALTNGELWKMDTETFKCYVLPSMKRKRRLFGKMFEESSAFHSLASYLKMLVSDALEEVNFSENKIIIAEGEEANGMYFILEGTVSVTVYNDKFNKNVVLNELGRGDYFGELGLLTGKPRCASVIANPNVKLGFLGKHLFMELLSQYLHIFHKKIKSYEKQKTEAFKKSLLLSNHEK